MSKSKVTLRWMQNYDSENASSPILHLLLWENKSSITRVSNYARYSVRHPSHNMWPSSIFWPQYTEWIMKHFSQANEYFSCITPTYIYIRVYIHIYIYSYVYIYIYIYIKVICVSNNSEYRSWMICTPYPILCGW